MNDHPRIQLIPIIGDVFKNSIIMIFTYYQYGSGLGLLPLLTAIQRSILGLLNSNLAF